jgi:PEGA domain
LRFRDPTIAETTNMFGRTRKADKFVYPKLSVEAALSQLLASSGKEKALDHLAQAQVTTTPSGAEIFIDGKSTGQFSLARVQVPTGGHMIMMKLNGFQVARRGVQVSEGGTVIVTQDLKRQE